MTTIRENIVDDIMSSLAGTSGVGSRIYRDRVTALSRAELPAIVVETLSDTPQQNTSLPTLDWTMSVAVVVITRGDNPHELADPIIESMHARLVADLTLGGYAIDCQPGTVTCEASDGEQPTGVVSCEYVVRYRTSVADLSQ